MTRDSPPLIIYTSITKNLATNSNLSVGPVSNYVLTFLLIFGNYPSLVLRKKLRACLLKVLIGG